MEEKQVINMQQSEEIGELCKAILALQKDETSMKADGSNPHFNSKYSTLSNVFDTIKKFVSKHDLVTLQQIIIENDKSFLCTKLVHAPSGQWISSMMRLTPERNSLQGLGSAISYARRYSLVTILGLSTSDDDGNEATKEEEQAQRAKKIQQEKQQKLTQQKIETVLLEKGEYNALFNIVLEKY
ncbi:ERF family protein [Candidatus Woesearchaeota archaeon]|nr:ERF family protein [Candidatus Woesearchaeota archaeon]